MEDLTVDNLDILPVLHELYRLLHDYYMNYMELVMAG